jgi:ribosomal protein S18 acetylase RimI-like enzyme
MDPTALARLEHANLIEIAMLFGSAVEGALVRRDDGVVVESTRLPFLLFNQIIVEDDATPAALADAVRDMRVRDHAFVVNLRVGFDDRFVPQVRELGLVQLSKQPWMPGMAHGPITVDRSAPQPRGFEIRRETDWAGVETHIRTGAVGFGMPEDVLAAVFSPALLGRDDVSVYVGYADGEPVATGLGAVTDRTVGVYNIATVPEARGRGCGAAMTRRIMADGEAAGCDVAILQSSEMGYPIYERLGFRTVVEYMAWVEPGKSGEPAH